MPLDPAFQGLFAQLEAAGGPALHELSPAQAREAYAALTLPAPEVSLAAVEDHHLPGPAGPVPVRVYRPEGPEPQPALVFFHGGGWVIGSLDTHDGPCRDLARRARCTVVSVDYRLAPEHPFPAGLDDAFAALCAVAEKGPSWGIDPARLAVGGDSAGGNLAAAAALRARSRGGPALRFQLLVYPVTDADFERPSYRDHAEGFFLTRDAMRWFWDHYVPDPAARRHPHAAPLHAPDLTGLPATYVLTAEYDPLRDEGEAFAERLREAGVPVACTRGEGMIHGFFSMTTLSPRADALFEEAARALREGLA
jgi:acetyl esterase